MLEDHLDNQEESEHNQEAQDVQVQEQQQEEGGKKKDFPDHPKVQKRIDKLVGENKSKDSQIESLVNEVKSLKSSVDRVSQTQVSQINKESEREIIEKKASIQRDVQEAFNDGDEDKHTQAMNRLHEVIEEEARLKSAASNNHQSGADSSSSFEDNDLEIFKGYNPWFGVDEEKTKRAISIDNSMKLSGKYNHLSNREFLSEVSRQVNLIYDTERGGWGGNIGISGGVEGGAAPPKQNSIQDKIDSLTEAQKTMVIARNKKPGLSKEQVLKDYAQYMT